MLKWYSRGRNWNEMALQMGTDAAAGPAASAAASVASTGFPVV